MLPKFQIPYIYYKLYNPFISSYLKKNFQFKNTLSKENFPFYQVYSFFINYCILFVYFLINYLSYFKLHYSFICSFSKYYFFYFMKFFFCYYSLSFPCYLNSKSIFLAFRKMKSLVWRPRTGAPEEYQKFQGNSMKFLFF